MTHANAFTARFALCSQQPQLQAQALQVHAALRRSGLQQELTTCARAGVRHSSSSATVHGTRHRMSCVWLAPGGLLSRRLRARCGLCCRSMRAQPGTAAVQPTTSRRAVLRLRSAWAGQQRSAVLPLLAGGCEDGLQCEDMQRRQALLTMHTCFAICTQASPAGVSRNATDSQNYTRLSDVRCTPAATMASSMQSSGSVAEQVSTKSTGHVHVPIC